MGRRRRYWLAGVLAVCSAVALLAWYSQDHFTAAERSLLARVKASPVNAAYITENDIPVSSLVRLGHFGCGFGEDLATLTPRLSQELAAHMMGGVQGFSVGMVVVNEGAKILCPPK